MKLGRPTMRPLIVFLAMLLLIPQPAHAYIDPGIGSLLFQGAIAGFIAIAAAWTAFKMKISSLFGKTPPASEDQSRGQTPSQPNDPS